MASFFGTNLQIVSNRVEHSSVGSANAGIELFNIVSLGDDQFAQIDLPVFAGIIDVRAGVALRSNPASDYRYDVLALRNFPGGGSEHTILEKVVNGVSTNVTTESVTTWVNGDVIRLEAIGSNFRVLRNGASLLTAVDSAIEGGGWPGIIMYVGVGGSLADNQADNWLGGDMTPLNNFNFPKPKIRDAARAGWIA